MESKREHLWHLLQIGMDSKDIPPSAAPLETSTISYPDSVTSKPPQKTTKRTRKKHSEPTLPQDMDVTQIETPPEPKAKKKQTKSKKTVSTTLSEVDLEPLNHPNTATEPRVQVEAIAIENANVQEEQFASTTKKKPGTRVGQRKPKRDAVGKSMSN